MGRKLYLSHPLSETTPHYGGGNKASVIPVKTDRENHTLSTTEATFSFHTGTHIDFPEHFFQNSKTADKYSADFWFFNNPLIIEIQQESKIIKDNLLSEIKKYSGGGYDIILVKTFSDRSKPEYQTENYGFDPEVAVNLRKHLRNVRVMGFDSISLSSYTNRTLGRKAHMEFLRPDWPILPLEDMKLDDITEGSLKSVTVMPLIAMGADAAPCTVVGDLYD